MSQICLHLISDLEIVQDLYLFENLKTLIISRFKCILMSSLIFRPHRVFCVKISNNLSKIMNAILSTVVKLFLTYHMVQSTILRGKYVCVCVCVCGLQLIFSNEYTQAEGHNWHLKHFCCFDCDCVLAGETYVMENEKPVCTLCYMKNHAVVKRRHSFISIQKWQWLLYI